MLASEPSNSLHPYPALGPCLKLTRSFWSRSCSSSSSVTRSVNQSCLSRSFQWPGSRAAVAERVKNSSSPRFLWGNSSSPDEFTWTNDHDLNIWEEALILAGPASPSGTSSGASSCGEKKGWNLHFWAWVVYTTAPNKMLNVTGLWSLQDRLCSKFLRWSSSRR